LRTQMACIGLCIVDSNWALRVGLVTTAAAGRRPPDILPRRMEASP
jgi:hypothetical protein